MKRTSVFLVILFSILFTFQNSASALTIEVISIEQMTLESHAVVMGRVVDSYTVWEGNNIYTYSTIQITDVLKDNDLGRFVTVKQLGGTVRDVTQDISGTPVLYKGEDLLLFLTFWKGNYWIHSIILGKYSIIEENGEYFALNDLNNIGLIDPLTKREITDHDEKLNKFNLSAFINDIRKVVAEG